MDPDSKRLRVSVTDGRGRPLRDGGLARWLESVAPPGARGEVAIALAGDLQVRALNRTYRRQDRPTDVLSFPAADGRPATSRRRTTHHGSRTTTYPPSRAANVPHAAARTRRSFSRSAAAREAEAGGPRILGDIVIATGIAYQQAREAGHSTQTELRVLALHGLLHLLGYDHHDPADRIRMARAEARLRRKGGLAAGLIERARRRNGRS